MTVYDQTEQFYEALCLWREARGETAAAKQAILCVIRNRAGDAMFRWPRTALGVILQPKQFSSFDPGDPNAAKLPDPKNKPDWDAWVECVNIVQSPLTADSTGGATNYESCAPDKLPKWADPSKLTVTIGPFRFYKL